MTRPFGLPTLPGNWEYFQGPRGGPQMYVWQIPYGCIALDIQLCGAGGNGGNGFTRAAAAAGGIPIDGLYHDVLGNVKVRLA